MEYGTWNGMELPMNKINLNIFIHSQVDRFFVNGIHIRLFLNDL